MMTGSTGSMVSMNETANSPRLEFNYRPYNREKDYATLTSIWSQYGWKPIPADFLPAGIVAELDGIFIAAMFVYVDHGTVAFVDFALADPSVPSNVRFMALLGCFNWIKHYALECGCRYIYTVTAIKRYQNMLEFFGMKECESDMKSYILPLFDQDVSALE